MNAAAPKLAPAPRSRRVGLEKAPFPAPDGGAFRLPERRLLVGLTRRTLRRDRWLWSPPGIPARGPAFDQAEAG